MTTLIFRDTPPTTLAGPINAAATTINVASGTGALFPQPTSGQGFYAFMKDAATRTLTEVILVTAVTGDTMTVVRGQGTLSAGAGGRLVSGKEPTHRQMPTSLPSQRRIHRLRHLLLEIYSLSPKA